MFRPLGLVTCTVVMTDASTSGCGAVCEGVPTSGLWLESHSRWHINHLELKVVSLALVAFLSQLEQQHVLIHTDNMSVVSYITCQGGVLQSPFQAGCKLIVIYFPSER